MKTKQVIIQHLPSGFIIKPELIGKYAGNPFFKEKAEKMKQILEKHPLPEIMVRNKK